MSISVVITTYNEQDNIERVLKSVQWADEVIVCDMYSEDKTQQIAKKLGAKIYLHEKTGFVEPARNFSISKAISDWVLVMDADEELPPTLKSKILEVISENSSDYVEVPRKNIIFNKWIQNKGWWPDYNIRLFKKGKVTWSDVIHSKPQTHGIGLTLDSSEELAIIHHHYSTISQYITRMNVYTDIQSKELRESGYVFAWQDIINQPINEFLSRFFDREGYKDGLHGFALSFLQAFSALVVYLKVWEQKKFESKNLTLKDFEKEFKINGDNLEHWLDYVQKRKSLVHRLRRKIKKTI